MHMDSTAGPGAPFTPQPIPPSGTVAAYGRGAAADEGRFSPQVPALLAEIHELRAQIESLRADRARMADVQGRMMEVLGCKSPDRLVHDLRNVLNERDLYRALADSLPD